MSAIVGAVNGVPTSADVAILTDLVTIPFFPAGATSTLAVETDGSGNHAPNHRVAIIGGTTSGRDHFPYPVLDITGDGPFGNHTVFPFDLAAATALYMWAVVKRWHFSVNVFYQLPVRDPDTGDYSWGPTIQSGAQFNFKIPINQSDLASGPFTREADSVLYVPTVDLLPAGAVNWSIGAADIFDNNPQWSISDYSDFVGAGDPDSTPFGLTLVFPLTAFWRSDTSKLIFHVELGVERGDQVATSNGGSDSWPELLNDDQFVVNSAGLGFTEMSAGFRSTTAHDLGGVVTGLSKFIDVEATIQAQEFWPYAATTGTAIYDTSTGAVLNDPLS